MKRSTIAITLATGAVGLASIVGLYHGRDTNDDIKDVVTALYEKMDREGTPTASFTTYQDEVELTATKKPKEYLTIRRTLDRHLCQGTVFEYVGDDTIFLQKELGSAEVLDDGNTVCSLGEVTVATEEEKRKAEEALRQVMYNLH
ncbi:hypothetical protein JW711_02700 [Candidatus Woesearchaeota archaeon]|nr:hypothetical protein [Candidatus Woesearchaeota archaeon]